MLNIRRGWLVPVTMLNIGRGRRREHPKDTYEGVTWPSVTTDVAQLPVAYTQRELRRGQVTFGSHGTTTKRKTQGEKAGHAQNLLPVRVTSGQVLFRSRDFVTSGQKAPLGRICHNFRLRMRRTYFRTVSFRSRDWRHFRSYHFRSCHFRSTARSTANTTLSVPIYYFALINFNYFLH